jgi:hypothetical protein
MIATSTIPSSVVPEIRVRVFGTPIAMTETKVVTLKPTAALFFHVCSGINPTAKIPIVGAFAEELFDLSNNPMRDEQREKVWGKNRSLSVGDVVEVDFCDGEKWMAVCKRVGWAFLPFDQELIDRLEKAPHSFERGDVVDSIETAVSLS